MSAPGPAGISAIPVASLYNLGRREGYIERRRKEHLVKSAAMYAAIPLAYLSELGE